MLVHRCDVLRRRAGADRFGQPHMGKGDFSLNATSIRCRLTHGSGGRRDTERTTDIVAVNYRLAVPPETDVREQDRVNVKDAAGHELLADALVDHVRVVTDGQGNEHHREAALIVTRPATKAFA